MERKPIQVYLSDEERSLLDRLAGEHGVPRAEILRRGIRAFAVQHAGGRSPMLNLARELTGGDWPGDTTVADAALGWGHDAPRAP